MEDICIDYIELVYICFLRLISYKEHGYKTSRKRTYKILTPLSPTFI